MIKSSKLVGLGEIVETNLLLLHMIRNIKIGIKISKLLQKKIFKTLIQKTQIKIILNTSNSILSQFKFNSRGALIKIKSLKFIVMSQRDRVSSHLFYQHKKVQLYIDNNKHIISNKMTIIILSLHLKTYL